MPRNLAYGSCWHVSAIGVPKGLTGNKKEHGIDARALRNSLTEAIFIVCLVGSLFQPVTGVGRMQPRLRKRPVVHRPQDSHGSLPTGRCRMNADQTGLPLPAARPLRKERSGQSLYQPRPEPGL